MPTRRRRHTPERVVRKLRQADRLLNEGADVPAVARHLGASEATYHRWRNQYGGMKADEAKPLCELERENRELKQRRRQSLDRHATYIVATFVAGASR